MKLAICGPGRSGKDTVAVWLAAHTTLRYWGSTSQVIAPLAAARLGLSEAEAFARRHEDRDLWYRLGIEIRQSDPAYLARHVLKYGDICVGVRDRAEMEAVRRERLVDLAIWLDRPGLPNDPTLGYGSELCDVVVQNWWGVAELVGRVERLATTWGVMRLRPDVRQAFERSWAKNEAGYRLLAGL